MQVSIARLRSLMLVLAVLLVVAILSLFGYARWKARRIARDLPAKLGISIQRSTNGFDISKSEGGRTLFKLHAAKVIQYTGRGRAALHDVSITLYGPNGEPTDRIYGDDFAYDPARSLVRANGAVQIDLQGPAASAGSAAGNVVHVKTADLIFDQKTGLATTSQPIDFRVAEASGSALGASFNAHTGIFILGSKVVFDSSLQGHPLKVQAGHAQFDRAAHRLYLLDDQADYLSAHSSSEQAIVAFRPDGSAYRIDLQGHVQTTKGDQTVLSPKEQVNLDEKSQPQQVLLDGGVVYTAIEPSRHLHGTAVSGVLTFGPGATVRHAQLKNAVSIVDAETPLSSAHVARAAASANSYVSTNREVEASQIDVDFEQAGGRSVASRILAQGGATLNVRTLYSKRPPEETLIRGDRILATLRDGVVLSTVRGDGHTKLVMISPSGVTQTSTGDQLLMDFASVPKRKHGAALAAPQRAASLESAEQEGNVIFVQQTANASVPRTHEDDTHDRSSGAAAPGSGSIRATAERAIFDAAKNTITLSRGVQPGAPGKGSGQPRVEQAGGALTANKIEFERSTGDATALGDVQATYRQAAGAGSGVPVGAPEPVHVIAAQAHLDHAKDLTFFYGAGGQDARLWQGADSISAPILELAGAQQTLAAHGAAGSGGRPVRVVLSSAAENASAAEDKRSAQKSSAAEGSQPTSPSIVRVSSASLLYSDRESKAQLRGGVVMLNTAGTLRCDAMDIFLGQQNEGGSSGSSRVKQVERIVARGQVLLEQPSRRATGNELVYTAKDGKFILTGTRDAPPRLTDQAHGTVIGSSLIFNNRDDSVIVSGGPSSAVTEMKK